MTTGRLIIHRIDQESYKMLPIEVYLNDKKVYQIRNNETRNIEIPEGEHTVFAKVGWAKSPQVKFSVQAGGRKNFRLGSPPADDKKHIFFIGMILFLVGGLLSKYYDNHLIFWIAVGASTLFLFVYLYFTIFKMEHLLLEEA